MNNDNVTMYWFWPERHRTTRPEHFVQYRTAASANGFELKLVAADDISVSLGADGGRVFVKGEEVNPGTAVFHNKLYTWPAFSADTWRYLALFSQLEHVGFHCLIRSDLNIITNDKVATILHLGKLAQPTLPTLSVFTRDFWGLDAKPFDAAGIGYPVVAKPAHWASGMGVTRAYDEAQLVMALRLASASELTMVIQPMLDADLSDVRVYCIENEPKYAMRRRLGPNGTVANYTSGGVFEIIPVPEHLVDRSRRIAERIDTCWLGVDYLISGGESYLSEVEIEATIPSGSGEAGLNIMTERFAAYRKSFEDATTGRK
jgi:glutathione synthase/RimK-type ligase-like ATP-grasp enzyme